MKAEDKIELAMRRVAAKYETNYPIQARLFREVAAEINRMAFEEKQNELKSRSRH